MNELKQIYKVASSFLGILRTVYLQSKQDETRDFSERTKRNITKNMLKKLPSQCFTYPHGIPYKFPHPIYMRSRNIFFIT